MPLPDATVYADFQALLSGVSGLSALVGSRVAQSLHPQGTALPCVTWHVIAAPTDYAHDGDTPGQFVCQIDVFALGIAAARTIADAIKNGLSGARTTEGSTLFESIFHDGNERVEAFETQASQASTKGIRISVDWRVSHRPA